MASQYSLAQTGKQEFKVFLVEALHQSNKESICTQRSLENGLQEAVRSNLDGDGVAWHLLQTLLEEDGADQIVDVVFCRGVLGELLSPPGFWHRCADPLR